MPRFVTSYHCVTIGTVYGDEGIDLLYKVGRELHREYGLRSYELLGRMFEVNSVRCNPPLKYGEVAFIAANLQGLVVLRDEAPSSQ